MLMRPEGQPQCGADRHREAHSQTLPFATALLTTAMANFAPTVFAPSNLFTFYTLFIFMTICLHYVNRNEYCFTLFPRQWFLCMLLYSVQSKNFKIFPYR